MPPKKKTHQKKNPGQGRQHAKRHVYKSLQDQSKAHHVNLRVAPKLDFTQELEESSSTDPTGAYTSTPFTLHLAHLSLLNLSTSFQALLKELTPLVQTFPLLLFNKSQVVDILVDVLRHPEETNPEDGSGSLPSILDLLPQLALSLLDEFLPFLEKILPPLLDLSNSPFHLPLLFPSLSALLKPMSPLLLQPENHSTLQKVWSIWVPHLLFVRNGGRANGGEQRRLAVEGWGSLLRRGARGEKAERVVGLMVSSLRTEEETGEHVDVLREGVGLILVEALKGPVPILPSTTPHLFQTLLSALLDLPAESLLPKKLLSNVLTALIHHTSPKPEMTEGVIDVLVKASSNALEEDHEADILRITRLVDALGVVSAARKGKGVTTTLHTPLLSLLPPLFKLSTSSSTLQNSFVYLVSTLLPITNLPAWLKYRSTVEALWESLEGDWARRSALVGMWVVEGSGWKRGGDVLFGGVLERSLFSAFKQTSVTSPSLPHIINLLNNLSRANLLTSAIFKSPPRETLGPHLASLLDGLKSQTLSSQSKDEVLILDNLLLLIGRLEDTKGPMWGSLVGFLREGVQAYKQSTQKEGEVILDLGFILDEVLQTIGVIWENNSGTTIAQGVTDIRSILFGTDVVLASILSKTVVPSVLLKNLSQVLQPILASGSAPTGWETLVPLLESQLMSSSSEKRKAALKILVALPTKNTSVRAVLDQALAMEEIELSVKDARERCVGVARLERAIQNLSGEKEEMQFGLDVGLKVLTAQLKVNLRPLYPATHTALASLAAVHGDQVWALLLHQLTLASQGPHSVLQEPMPAWADNSDGIIEEKEEENDEAVRCFRDPSRKAAEELMRSLVEGDGEDRLRAIADSRMPFNRDRLDVLNYEIELVHALAAAPSLAEKHSRDFISLFLSFTSRSNIISSSLDADEFPVVPADSTSLPRLTLKQVHLKLTAYLSLFAKFVNPKAIYRSDEMHSLYLSLLAKGDPKLQLLALDCIFTFKNSKITPYKDSLKMLLDEVRFRDELTKFSLVSGGASVNPAHRDELIPLVIRMLYGKMIARRGRSSASNGPGAKKQAILSALAGCATEELSILVELMLAPFGGLIESQAGPSSGEFTLTRDDSDLDAVFIPGKQQIGFLSLLGDVLKYLGPQLMPSWPRLLGTTMELIHRAQTKIGKMKAVGSEEKAEVDAEDVVEDEDEEENVQSHTTPVRAIRQLGLKRFADFFKSSASVDFNFKLYLPAAFKSFISPRLASLNTENTQAPSGLLELFAIWSTTSRTVPFLVQYDTQLLSKVYSCLTATNVKPAVVSKIYDIVERLLAFGSLEDDENERATVVNQIIKPYVDELLGNLSVLVERPLGSGQVKEELAKRQIRILSGLASYVTNGPQSARLVALLSPMLRKPAKVVPERVKSDILLIFKSLLPLIPEFSDRESSIFVHSFNLLSTLFQSLRSKQARQALCEVLLQFPPTDSDLQAVVDVIVSINSFSERRKEEPDFDRRLAAFSTLNEQLWSTLTVQQWLPIIYNMLYYIQDPEEMSIRTNAAFGLRRFVERTAAMVDDQSYLTTFTRVLFPGIRNGLRTRTELVRTEILSVLSTAVSLCVHIPILQEMQPLLAGGDHEASFFTNIHHIQTHRRIRALHRLSELCDDNIITNSNLLADIFLPLLAHFINNSSGKTDHHLINEAITSTGKISKQLKWAAYNGLVRQYIRLAKEKTENEKFFIRTVVSILDHFHFLMEEPVIETEIEDGAELTVEEHDIIVIDEKSAEVAAEPPVAPVSSQALYIADAVETRLLPSLLSYLQQKDETEDSIRIPIAIGIVKVALNLPEQSRDAQISRLLTTLSQVFRSKSQETRDLAKETIIKIAVTLGPEWLAPLIHEMKAALQRGPQLHVLAFTVHAILVHVTSLASSEFSDLDDCVHDVVAIAAEVVFGESGKDLQAEGFKTKMREVRTSTSKGLDTFQLVARLISPEKIGQILVPIKEVLGTTQVLKVLQQVDDVLRRVASGLNSNERLSPPDVLILCHTLIGQNSHLLQGKKKSVVLKDSQSVKNFLVSIKRSEERAVDHYASNAYKFVGFGLELFITAFRRGRFVFSDTDILSRLDPLVNLIGESLFSVVSDIVILGLKATAAIVKAPVESLTAALPTFVQQIFKTIKHAGSTESDLSQQALRTLSIILRDCKEVDITQKQMSYLLELITPDLEDPSRQAAIFALLHSIISRKFVVADIYDVMDKVAETMVTSQSAHVQEQCRSNVLRFLLDYPQGSGRLKKQMQFLVNNLTYVYESGRLSVMELLGAVFDKFDEKHIQDYSDSFFMGLALVIANDESVKCREMAAELLKGLLPRLTSEQLADTVSKIHIWANTPSQAQLPRLAAQIYGLFLDSIGIETRPYVSSLLIDVQEILASSATTLEAYEIAQEDPSPFAMEIADDLDWQLPYQSLSTLAKVLKIFPDEIATVEWHAVTGHILFPHAWVRLASARLVGTLFGSSAPSFDASQSAIDQDGPLQPRGLFSLARQSLLQLKGESIDEALAIQVVKNIVYLGRCFALGTSLPADSADAEVVEAPPVDKAEAEEEDLNDDDDGDEEEEEEIVPEDEEETATEQDVFKRALDNPSAWLFTKLSQLARTILITRPAVHGEVSPRRSLPILSIFRLFAALASVLDPSLTKQYLMQILHPIQRVLDANHPSDEEIRNMGVELQTLIQAKVGISAFSSVWNSIQRTKAMKRQARRNEKIVRTTTNPEGAALRKRYKNEQKKESHKRKIRTFADSKIRERPMKARRTRDPMPDDA
ncbi:DRIM (Down-regulated in metastasis)-like proteins [Phaffia rhodozyma]|uniref:DRIM (Down-regulated in metastasis)-like proteins n=1 Tax=Phaffia rhodozyma TaxID=264483 RepID=A0A0F7SH24_PHARH|nr:DRIM (Down-regulated in metastasis)-like proteins [Phaffia rhodozyma]